LYHLLFRGTFYQRNLSKGKLKMKITFRKYEVKLGSRTYKVLIPIPDIEDLYVVSTDATGAVILGNECSLEKFENILTVAATNKDSIIFIPSRKNELTEYLLDRWSNKDNGNDLVLLHHTIQFKRNDWKAIRSLIRKSKNENIEEIIVTKDQEGTRNLSKYWYREHKDYLDIKEQYETLFLIGSKEIFVNISIDSREVREEGRDLYVSHPGYHAHEHIDYYERRKHNKDYKDVGWSLCLDFYDRELWKR